MYQKLVRKLHAKAAAVIDAAVSVVAAVVDTDVVVSETVVTDNHTLNY
jgi:hypothetical protein